MGNLCSKSANESDNFSTPGRVVGSSNIKSQPTSAPVPAKLTTTTPGRQLGGGAGDASTTGDNNARSAAAKAAEVSSINLSTLARFENFVSDHSNIEWGKQERAAKANKSGGKLANQLSAQKKQTQNQLLNSGSDAERRARDADQNTQARNWN